MPVTETAQIPISYWERRTEYDSTRQPTELRPITKINNKLTRSDGSIEYRQGNTIVICSINGPLPCERSKELPDQAVVEVNLHLAPVPPSTANHELFTTVHHDDAYQTLLTQQIHQLASSLLELKSYPRQKVAVNVDVVSQDGSILAVASNAVLHTIYNSGVAACLTTYTLSCAKILFNGQIIYKLDPTLADEAFAEGLLTVTFKNPTFVHNLSEGSSMDKITHLRQQEEETFNKDHAQKTKKPKFVSNIEDEVDIVQFYTEKNWKSNELLAAIEVCTEKWQTLLPDSRQ